ncbi:hypothetical protein J0A71_02g04430 [Encephalitozoon cuniculi]|nr:hypothetical protein J0A71_02g04430 [Encephalitozoon cuniculi]
MLNLFISATAYLKCWQLINYQGKALSLSPGLRYPSPGNRQVGQAGVTPERPAHVDEGSEIESTYTCNIIIISNNH